MWHLFTMLCLFPAGTLPSNLKYVTLGMCDLKKRRLVTSVIIIVIHYVSISDFVLNVCGKEYILNVGLHISKLQLDKLKSDHSLVNLIYYSSNLTQIRLIKSYSKFNEEQIIHDRSAVIG